MLVIVMLIGESKILCTTLEMIIASENKFQSDSTSKAKCQHEGNNTLKTNTMTPKPWTTDDEVEFASESSLLGFFLSNLAWCFDRCWELRLSKRLNSDKI